MNLRKNIVNHWGSHLAYITSLEEQEAIGDFLDSARTHRYLGKYMTSSKEQEDIGDWFKNRQQHLVVS